MGTRRESERDCDGRSIDETCLSPLAAQQASIDFLELGAKIHCTELMPHSHYVSSHVNDMQKMTLDLGAKACKLAPIITTPRSGSIFLKDTARGVFIKNLSKKELKSKKKKKSAIKAYMHIWTLISRIHIRTI
jgi:hypothetical protein